MFTELPNLVEINRVWVISYLVQPMRLELTRLLPHAPQTCASAIPPWLHKCFYIILNLSNLSNNLLTIDMKSL